MLDVPFESLYTLVALSVAASLLVGVVAGLPTTPAPDTPAVAETIDTVAVADYDAMAEIPLTADAVLLGPHRIGLRNDGGAAHATFAFGPVTPARPDSRLGAVATGADPSAVFDSPAAFREATEAAQSPSTSGGAARSWQPAPESLVVRHVTWEGVDVTIVAA
ncbi:hypothetical protein ACH9L7_09240 [Haloferax sp. S1W]|uniref:DUF7283 family protein n=1 Tax=Haloferax sp. S1W TaxID=3377110 RepID=UPI0037C644D1